MKIQDHNRTPDKIDKFMATLPMGVKVVLGLFALFYVLNHFIGALIVAAVAAVVMLIVSRRKNKKQGSPELGDLPPYTDPNIAPYQPYVPPQYTPESAVPDQRPYAPEPGFPQDSGAPMPMPPAPRPEWNPDRFPPPPRRF